ncbi:MAG: hypothetical protein B7Y36_12820 [Novosphingobium sp. 28-62-57]|nr:MAG: hypothetical protein B7Z34_10110 [Novosphingobium sp. 12-62-10]OYZ09831.1 MAG: hypothetical protein B7Y36_12820 [Novosphingobium sp. 28-62-57]
MKAGRFTLQLSPVLVPLLLAACSGQSDPQPAPSASAKAGTRPTTAAAQPDQSQSQLGEGDGIPVRFRAIGTEPFWSVQMEDGLMTYATPEMPEGETVPVTMEQAGLAQVYSATIDGTPMELEVTRKVCSDGMSDTVYPMSVTRRLGADVHQGCAR